MGSLLYIDCKSNCVSDISQRGEIHAVIIRIWCLRQRRLIRLKVVIDLQTGTGRNQLADEDVLLQADEMIDLALDRSIGQHLCGLLEGRSGEEALGRERRLCDAHEDLREGDKRNTLFTVIDPSLQLSVHGVDLVDVNDRVAEKRAASGIIDANLAHHLADNDLNVLIVDVDALLAVNLLDLLNDILLAGGDTADTQNIMGASPGSWLRMKSLGREQETGALLLHLLGAG